MTKDRVWVWGSALAGLLIFVIGWIAGVQPQLNKISTTNTNRDAVVSQNGKDEILLTQLKHDYQNIDLIRSELVQLRNSIPVRAEISSFVTELNSLATNNQVTVKSISVNDAKPYTPNTGSVDPESTGAITDPRITAANFVIIPVQFSVAGNYAKVLDFMRAVQTAQRLFFVSTFGSTGSTEASAQGKVDSTVGGYMYVILDA